MADNSNSIPYDGINIEEEKKPNNEEKILKEKEIKESIHLQKEVANAIKNYDAIQSAFNQEVKEMRKRKVPEAEILALTTKRSKVLQNSLEKFNSNVDELTRAIDKQVEKNNIDISTSALFKSQLQRAKNKANSENDTNEILNGLRGQIKDIFVESKASRIAELEQLKIEKNREKRESGAKKKGAWITALFTPFRALTDPLLKAITDKDTEEFITEKFLKKEKDRQKEEDKAKEQGSQIIELIKNANERLAELGINQRITGDDLNIENLRNQGLAESEQKFKSDELIALSVKEQMSSIDLTKLERDEAKALADRGNKDRILSDLAGIFGGVASEMAAEALEQRHLENDINEHKQYIGVNGTAMQEISPSAIAVKPLALSSSVDDGVGIEQGGEYQGELNIMDKINPDQNSLLAKGGVVGAGFVFLAKKMGLITGDGKKDEDDKKGFGEGAIGFIKKNGLGLLKVAVPLLAVAAGGAMIAAGVKMQKRDTEDSKKYFEEGDKARGVETFILGDRARLTEENANRELGRTTGKTALMAGGAGLVAAGGAGTAAMIGTVASAGGIAAAGGLGAVGTAGLAAMGAVLPPALIAGAVITAGVVIAKGTQEAFELGWDKNQAAIQKELTETMLSDDATMMQKIKAGAASTWKGFTGSLAGGIREAGKVLDAETMIQNEKRINFIKEQAEAGSGSYQRLLEMMESEQFQAMNKAEQKAMMQAEGLYDEFQEAAKKSFGEHLFTAGKTVGGFFSGLVDTTMEGMRGRETAVWEKAALKGMEDLSEDPDRVDRLKKSDAYREAMENGGNHKKAMQAAYLAEEREKAVARGDLREDGMAIQEGNWLAGMLAGGATGGIPGALVGALGGAKFGKYLGIGDTGMAYKKKQSDEEYRQTFEYSKKKAELMGQGMTAEEADLAAIEEQNALYDRAVTLRLKQSKDYKKVFDRKLKEGKSIKEAEEEALEVANKNKENTMTTSELIKVSLTKSVAAVKKFVKDPKKGIGDLSNLVVKRAQELWNSLSEWFSGIFNKMGDVVKGIPVKIGEGWNKFKGKANDAKNWVADVLSGEVSTDVSTGDLNDDIATNDVSTDGMDDGIVTKDGKVIKLSPDDNVYATKNEPRVIRDQEAQRAMPDVPRIPAEFTDAGIIKAIQVLTDVLKNKDMLTTVIPPVESISFDQFRMADVLE